MRLPPTGVLLVMVRLAFAPAAPAQQPRSEGQQRLVTIAARNPCRIRRVFTLDAEPFMANGEETAFGRVCRKLGIEHHLTSSPHPWTRGRGARMRRLLQPDVTFSSEAYIVRLVGQFVHAYNFRRRLKTLRGMTPYDFLCHAWNERPELFLRDPHHDLMGLEFMHR